MNFLVSIENSTFVWMPSILSWWIDWPLTRVSYTAAVSESSVTEGGSKCTSNVEPVMVETADWISKWHDAQTMKVDITIFRTSILGENARKSVPVYKFCHIIYKSVKVEEILDQVTEETYCLPEVLDNCNRKLRISTQCNCADVIMDVLTVTLHYMMKNDDKWTKALSVDDSVHKACKY